MRNAIAVLLALSMLIAPALAQLSDSCELNSGSEDSECYGLAFERGVVTCEDDFTGQTGICDYRHRCNTCLPSNMCAELYFQGFVGCHRVPEFPGPVVHSAGASSALAGYATGEAISTLSPNLLYIAVAASIAVLASGIAMLVGKVRSKKVKKAHIRALEKERKELKKTNLDYGKIAAVLIMLGIGSMLAGISQTGYFLADGTALVINGRWAVLGMFAAAIILYAWICHRESKR